jgi:RNA-binding protein PNO1|eukprot:CAMPEP_0174291954 /NCGR_PEP_ID=MMETSP0809-20121228/33793_1 /TAXON_ID=73025 ORGANISM="Eutreptiella gymnastica-like, Strain CCMP1594" /NCGR_SAMPLE_ID=MMETSP0809 /ASSEMBLY_ACC=CAM_ASM_000658 /LENGTH=209 /DNA_ID=CAMNT_0015391685 /DNA_START=34 /DNA_END=663 /DNA_ORIENTATION=-
MPKEVKPKKVPKEVADAKKKPYAREKQKEMTRSVKVPAHRYTPLKEHWMEIYTPLVDQCKLEVRMNLKNRTVDIRPSKECTDPKNMGQKGVDFVTAFILGFEVPDCLALLRMDDIFLNSFMIKDVKTLEGDHLSRAIGRMSGSKGKTKFTIENQTRTRIVLAGSHVHIMGSFQNIRVARRAFSELIRGSPAGKIYRQVEGTMNRVNDSF